MTTVVIWLWATLEGDRWIVFLKNPVASNTFYKMSTRLSFVVREDFLTAASTMRTGLQMMVLTLFLQHHQVYIHLVQQKLTFLNLDIFMGYIASYSLRLLQSNLWQGFNFTQPCVNFVVHKRFRISIFSWGSHLHIASYACRMSLGMRLTYALPVEGLATRIKRESMFFFWY